MEVEVLVDDELRGICRDILSRGSEEASWLAGSHSDTFQTEAFCGGFDAEERAFCFSWYRPDGVEVWFEFSLEEAAAIAAARVCRLIGETAPFG
ncbi:MAG: hypothetical protein KDC38_00620 [Planctomycetes bacterium]|nr:hypothetical protein [Planctomycetota bacterium]